MIRKTSRRRPFGWANRMIALLMLLLLTSNSAFATSASAPAIRPVRRPPVPHAVKVRKGSRLARDVSPVLRFSSVPTDLELTTARVFEEQLIPMSGHAVAGENRALADTLLMYKQRADRWNVDDLSKFVSQFPRSRWRPAVDLNIGLLQFGSGEISEALTHWQSAWIGARNEVGDQQKRVADRAVSQLLLLHSRLGDMKDVEQYLAEVTHRKLTGSVEQRVREARESLWCMKHRPDIAFKCGPFAINSLLNIGKRVPERNQIVDHFKSSAKGTNLLQVNQLAHAVGLNLQIAKRTKGAAFVFPAVMHWKVNHFAAITGFSEGRYEVKDTTFGPDGNMRLSPAVLESETDGYFLIPDGPLRKGWATVTDKEASSVWGKGIMGGRDDGSHGPGVPTAPGGGNCNGLARATAFLMQATTKISDIPLQYEPPVGPRGTFLINYNYLEANQPTSFTFTNLGQDWTFNWVSYLTEDGSQNVTVRVGGGGSELFSYNTPSEPYYPNMYSQATLTNLGSGTWERERTDGSIEVFNQADGTGRIFMTKVIDPQGNYSTIQYDSNFRVTSITDALGQQSTVSYVSNTLGNSGFYVMSQISDPFGRTCSFTYDSTNSYLLSITDVMGMTSSFAYDTSSSFITLLTTPYGSTSMYQYEAYYAVEPTYPGRGLRFAYPDGSTSVLENFIGNSGYSYYWDREQSATYPLDPVQDVYTHCTSWQFLIQGSSTYTENAVIQNMKAPLENQVTFTYTNEGFGTGPYGYNVLNPGPGTINKPITISRTLDDITVTQKYAYTYNALGKVTQATDPVGRVLTLTYASNNIDLTEVKQTRGGNNDVLGQWTFNSSHLPLVQVDGSGQRTQFSYNGYGELTSIVDAKGETTTLSYNSNGYLTQIQGPLSGSSDVMSFTYDGYGRLYTMTDAEGYEVAFGYDAMNRMTQITYPDGTSETVTFNRLDPIQFTDRLGRVVSRTYDQLREPVTQTDPLGRLVKYSWCLCGGLASITDPAGNVTSYQRDLEGRVIQQTYPDQTTENFSYYNSISLTKSRTDALNQTANFVYNTDNSLQQISYSNTVNPTSNVTFSYDVNYQRISSVQNGWGLINYCYGPFAGGASVFASTLLGGSITVGDTISLTFTNPALSSNPHTVNYTVQSTDTTLSILAASVASTLNSDSVLSSAGISASSLGASISVSAANSLGVTTVSPATTGTETLNMITVFSQNLTGTTTTGNVVNITVLDPALSTGKHNVQYSVASTDTTLSILAGSIANAINSDATLSAAGVSALSSSSVVSVLVPSSVGSTNTISNTNGTTTETIGGYFTNGDTVSITVQDAAFGQRTETHTVVSTDGATSVATALKNSINADSALSAAGITATSSSGVISIKSTSQNATTYTQQVVSSSSSPETITQGGGPTQFAPTTVTNGAGAGCLVYSYNSVINNSPLSYSYDVLGRCVNRSINGSGNSTAWTYDAISRVTQEANPLGTFAYSYLNDVPGSSKGDSRLASITYPNSQVTNFNYFPTSLDERLQQIQSLRTSSGPTISQLNYNYNAAGEITQWPQIQNNSSNFFQLGYDKAGQLVSASAANGQPSQSPLNQFGYAYDAVANRTAVQTSLATNMRVGGTVTAGDALTVTVSDPLLSGGSQSVSYTVQSGDTTASIATNLAAAITANANLLTLGVNAVSNGTTLTVKSVSPNLTTYGTSLSTGATETLTSGTNSNFVESAVIAGTVTAGDTLTTTVLDPALTGGAESDTYTVQATDTLTSIASGIKSAINSDSSLSAIGVTATSAGPVVTVTSMSSNATSYISSSSNGATETITLSVNQNGPTTVAVGGSTTTNDALTITVYDSGLTGGSESDTYSVQSSDTLNTIASGIASAINSDASLQAIGVSASSSGTILTLNSDSPNPTSYRQTYSTGATETLTFAVPKNGTQTAVVGGSKTTGDVLTITVTDAGLSGGSTSDSYTVQATDTLSTIASGIASAINGDSSLSGIGVTATSSGAVVFLTSTSVHATTYMASMSSGSSETLALGATSGATQCIYNNLNQLIAQQPGGAIYFHGAANKALTGAKITSDVVSIKYSQVNFPSYTSSTNSGATETVTLGTVQNGNNTATLGGTVTSGDVITIITTAPALSGGQESDSYTVASGNTLADIATGIKNAINADSPLAAIGVSATSSSNVLTISVSPPTYSVSTSSGATETITLGTSVNGTANVTIGGTKTTGDTLTLTTSNVALSGGAKSDTYTVLSSDTIPSIAAGLAAAINGDSAVSGIGVTASGAVAASQPWAKVFYGNAMLTAGTHTVVVSSTDAVPNTNSANLNLSISGPSATTLTYDLAGNMTSDGTNTYAYDAENRLISITYPGSGNSTAFTYDPWGRCVKIVENGTVPSFSNPATMQFVWCGANRCEARDGSGNVLAQYLAMGETQLVSSSLVPYYYTKDHLGSVREMTNSSGAVQVAYGYDPYGRVSQLSSAGSYYASQGFCGYYVHQRSGLNLTETRAYDPNFGRFVNRDPIGLTGGLNLYGYVGGNPISLADMSGLDPLGSAGNPLTGSISNDSGSGGASNDDGSGGTGSNGPFSGSCNSSGGGGGGGGGDGGPDGGPNPGPRGYGRGGLAGGGHTGSSVVLAITLGLALGAIFAPQIELPLLGEAAIGGGGIGVYSVLYRMELESTSYPGLSRAAHFQEANEALLQSMERDPQFAQAIRDQGVNLQRTSTGLAPRSSPPGWTWHHAPEPGVMELVPRWQHMGGSSFSSLMHPGGYGGYSIWGN